MQTIAVFDFLSHATMHLPFNAGYIKVLLAAFPDDEIILFADADHCENLKLELAGENRVKFTPQAGIATGQENLHSPITGTKAAKRCFDSVTKQLGKKKLRLAAMSGADSNLLRVFRSKWGKFSSSPLHYILHNHLAASFGWRSRNPYYRWFDFVAEFKRGLPKHQYWVALEKGIQKAVVDFASALKDKVIALPHPITYTSIASTPSDTDPNRALRIAFVGHCSADKGFDLFIELANEFAGPDLEFWAIGRESEALPEQALEKLTHRPTKGYLSSEEYYEALAGTDIVLLPLAEQYRYVASGSVLDAISALKPIITIENSTYRAIADEYGSFGPMLENRGAIHALFASLDEERFLPQKEMWLKALLAIRSARAPEKLAIKYAKAVLTSR